MILQIIISIVLIISAIFHKQLKKLPSRGDWIYEYEDEKWAKISIMVGRIMMFSVGMIGLIHALFFR